MKKLTATLVFAALALTACSAPASDQPQMQPFAATAPSATTEITAAPIEPQPVTATEDAQALVAGGYGDPSIDGPFLETVKGKWRGTPPSDGELVSAAKFACDALANGAIYETTGAVKFQEGDRDGELNNAMLSAYASLSYCEGLAY